MTGTTDAATVSVSRLMRAITVLAWVAVAVMVLFFVVRASTDSYTPDSWSYVDIARSFYESGRSIGDVQIARQYVGEPWLNNSFPLLWPLLLSLPMRFTGPAAPVGALYFAPVFLLTALTIHAILRAVDKPRVLAPLASLILLAIPGYAGEGSGGRSIPLTVLLLLVSLYGLLKFRVAGRWPWLAMSGLAAGLGAATRFDTLAFGPVLGLIALAIGWVGLRRLVLMLAFWAVGPLLWVAYSLTRLGVVYGSDNSHVVMNPELSGAGWWPIPFPGTPLDRLLGVVGRWAHNVSPTMVNFLQTLVALLAISVLAASLSAFALALIRRWRPSGFALLTGREPGALLTDFRLLVLGVVLALFLVETVMMATTGYFEDRYWAGIGALVILQVCLFFDDAAFARAGSAVAGWANTSIATFLVLAAVYGLMITGSGYTFNRDATAADASLVQCLQAAGGTPMMKDLRVFRIGATTDLRVAYAPNNVYKMTPADWQQLVDQYAVDRWVVTDETSEFVVSSKAAGLVTEVRCPG